MTTATTTSVWVSLGCLPNTLPMPNTIATMEMVKMLIMSAPNTFPSARPGAEMRTAVMFVTSSGSDVAMLTSIVPTQSAPQPVMSATASPSLASAMPASTTTTALARNTGTATARLSMGGCAFRGHSAAVPLRCA